MSEGSAVAALTGIVCAWLAMACAANHPNVPRVSQPQRLRMYALAPTEIVSPHFEPAVVSGRGFEWKTLTIRPQASVIEDGNQLVVVLDLDIENRGIKPFAWSDFWCYLAVPDEAAGSKAPTASMNTGGVGWKYHLVFTRNQGIVLPPGQTYRFHYSAQLPLATTADRYVFILQSMFGGRDVGLGFYRAAGI